jgi:hypothetical protein
MNNIAKYSVVIILSDKTAYLAATEERILKHLKGNYPKNYSMKKIASHVPVTFEMGDELMDNPAFNHINAVCNFL